MTESRLKWLFAVLCISILTFCLGWWLHNSNVMCITGCILQQDEFHSLHVTECPPCSIPSNSTNEIKSFHNTNGSVNLPLIFMITPTYSRTTQKADLTRLCQTLMHVKKLHWLIVEDSDSKTPLVTRFLSRCPVQSTQLNRKTSLRLQPVRASHKGHKNRGAEQRNIALDWLRGTYKPGEICGVVYFGDDDNTYDIQLFKEMRYTKKVSIWPVGLAGGLKAEGPRCKNGKVTSWHVGWSPDRKFPVDMAAFAVNLDAILNNSKVRLDPFGPGGRLETLFLSMLTTVPELEAKADDCTKVYVWHTQTAGASIRYEDRLPTNLEVYVWHTQTAGAYIPYEKKLPTTIEVKR